MKLWYEKDVKRIANRPKVRKAIEDRKSKIEARHTAKSARNKEMTGFLLEFTPEKMVETGQMMNRKFILHIGPTNSGKTYHAIEALKNRNITGAYFGPLRLLALEIFDTLNEEGFPCNLLTGEEEELVEGARLTSSTIEMCDFRRDYDVVVIDEAQLVNDLDRGGYWVRTICQVKAKEIHICMAPYAESLITELLEDMYADYEIKHYDRLVPLEFDGKMNSIKNVEPGDAVITFSRKKVLDLASTIEAHGLRTSVIYGALPPASRREEVRKFASGETQVVVATDSIGMGISLPIKRVIFAETSKFDGTTVRKLNSKEIQQIAGRAGRYMKYDIGLVKTMLDPGLVENALDEVITQQKYMIFPFPKEALNSQYKIDELMNCWQSLPIRGSFVNQNMNDPIILYNSLSSKQKKYDKELIFDAIMCHLDTGSDLLIAYWQECADAYFLGEDIPEPEYIPENSLEYCELKYKAWDVYEQMVRKTGLSCLKSKEKQALSKKINKFLDKRKSVKPKPPKKRSRNHDRFMYDFFDDDDDDDLYN